MVIANGVKQSDIDFLGSHRLCNEDVEEGSVHYNGNPRAR